MAGLYHRLVGVLGNYMSMLNAEGTLQRTLRNAGIDPAKLAAQDIPALLQHIDVAVRLFATPEKREKLRADVLALANSELPSKAIAIPILSENDIGRARSLARQMCEQLGAKPLVVQKVATIVSELARNITSYTPGGSIEIEPITGAPKRVIIRATDQGKGIPNLSEIMSGGYKSKTGLGLGILGSKRLADRFEIESNERGTKIFVEVIL